MNDGYLTIDPRKISVPVAAIAMAATAAALALLAALHVLSPEFSPAWRMVSEYANGRYPSVLSAMFVAYSLSSLALAFAIRSQLKTRSGRMGLAALVSQAPDRRRRPRSTSTSRPSMSWRACSASSPCPSVRC